jgi:hypothetical protein
MLLAKGRITKDLIAMLSNWRHSGFQVFCGQRLFPQDETAMENLARYIIRASFSQERMQYLAEPSKVVYRAKDGTKEKVFDAPVSSTGQALEWLAAMCSHIPDRGESRRWREYYGYYSNVSRGKRKETEDDGVPCILEADRRSLLSGLRLPLGCLPSVVKIRNAGRKEPVCPDEPQNRLTSLARSLKAPPLHLYPETPPNPR